MRIKGMKIMSVILSAALAFSIVPSFGTASVVQAEESKKVACLGTSAINAPEPGEADKPWTGSYVWYGTYNGKPVRYRVLDPKTSRFGGTTMFLDCDSLLYRATFRADSEAADANVWSKSDIRRNLNGDPDSDYKGDFLEKDGNFTPSEKAAIAYSSIEAHDLNAVGEVQVADWTKNSYAKYVALENDKVFLLDMEDLSNNAYGYSTTHEAVENRIMKLGSDGAAFWTRSTNVYKTDLAGYVYLDGELSRDYVNQKRGVNPAFNIDLNSVIFSSVIPGTDGEKHADYKLTLLDTDMTVALQSGKKAWMQGEKITIPYEISGNDKENATQVSVLILNKKYQKLNENDASILYYEKLNVDGDFSSVSDGTFDFPSELDMSKWGTDYQVYFLAEDVNGEKESDYASEPVKLDKPVLQSGVIGDCNWDLDFSTGTLTISGNGAMADYEISNFTSIPWFYSLQYIKNLVIEDGVTHIGDTVFIMIPYITSVSIPDSVKSIGDNAFLGCINLDSVDLGNGVETIGEAAFNNNLNASGNKLTSMIIPPSVTSIADKSIGYAYTIAEPVKIEDFTITGQCGSEAQNYAEKNEFTWYSNAHGWDKGVVKKESSCTEKGIIEYTCSCGETKTEEIDFKAHTLTKIPEKPATYTEEGNYEYYICSECGKWFGDDIGSKEITDHSSVIIPKLAAPTATPEVTATPEETGSPEATATPEVTPSLEPYTSPEPTPESEPTSTPTPDITRDANDISPSNPVKIDEIEKTILNIKDEKDTAGSSFTLLKAKGTPKSKKSIKLTWAKVPGAEKYMIYGNKCGKKNKYKYITTVTGTSYTAKKLKKGTYYKYTIVAVKGDEAIATSKTIHVTTDGGKKGNNTNVKLSKTKLSLTAGKSKKIKATLKYKKKKVSIHRKVAWESDNVTVATVKNGKIKAVGKGTCYVYAYAQNGVSAKIKVTVK